MPDLYLLRTDKRPGKPDLVWPAESFHASFHEITRPTGRTLAGLGRIVEGTGKYDRGHVSLRVTTDGGSWSREQNHYAAASTSSDGLRQVLRRARPDDAARLAAADAEVDSARAALDAALRARMILRAEAFTRGDRVLSPEVLRVADGKA